MPTEAWCNWCREPFSPVEYNRDGQFCSAECEELMTAAEQHLTDYSVVYNEARYGGATTLN